MKKILLLISVLLSSKINAAPVLINGNAINPKTSITVSSGSFTKTGGFSIETSSGIKVKAGGLSLQDNSEIYSTSQFATEGEATQLRVDTGILKAADLTLQNSLNNKANLGLLEGLYVYPTNAGASLGINYTAGLYVYGSSMITIIAGNDNSLVNPSGGHLRLAIVELHVGNDSQYAQVKNGDEQESKTAGVLWGDVADVSTSVVGDTLTINLCGDGDRVITLETNPGIDELAADIQAKVQVLTANDSRWQECYSNIVSIAPGGGNIMIINGLVGSTSTIVVSREDRDWGLTVEHGAILFPGTGDLLTYPDPDPGFITIAYLFTDANPLHEGDPGINNININNYVPNLRMGRQ